MNLQQFITVINTLEGLKTATKTAHWLENNLNTHKLLGDLYDTLTDYEDTFVESGIVIFGEFEHEDITSLKISSFDVVKDCYDFALKVKNLLPKEANCAGIQALTDEFVADMTKYVYLNRMA